MKYAIALFVALFAGSAYAGNCGVAQVQAVVQHHVAPVVQFVEVPHVQFVQPVRQQVIVERVVNQHAHVQQVQKVVVQKQQVNRPNVQVNVNRRRANVTIR